MMKFIAILLILFVTPQALAKLRIVSLHPAITENIFALGVGDWIVGTSEFSDYPEEAKQIPRVGDSRPLVEKIISLKPDLVLNMERDTTGLAETLKRASIRFQTIRANTLSDFSVQIKLLGKILDKDKKAQEVLTEWDKNWAKIKKENPSQNKSLVIQVEQQPLTIAGGDTFLSELISSCGYSNLFEEKKGYPQISQEVVLQKKPGHVLLLLASEMDASIARQSRLWKKAEEQYRTQFYFSNPNILSRLTPRLPLETMKLCQTLKR
ncbi:MAG: ABC transporter substrate-binding protein [Bdellovibrionales bacterium]